MISGRGTMGKTTAPLVEGSRDALDELICRGYCLGIVTSGSRIRVSRELKTLGLEEIFGTVVCSEDVVNKKPHPEGLEMAMKHLDKRPETCCYVGDSPVDMEMGKRAGMQTIGILSGYPSSKALPNTHPDFCFESIAQLLLHFKPVKYKRIKCNHVGFGRQPRSAAACAAIKQEHKRTSGCRLKPRPHEEKKRRIKGLAHEPLQGIPFQGILDF